MNKLLFPIIAAVIINGYVHANQITTIPQGTYSGTVTQKTIIGTWTFNQFSTTVDSNNKLTAVIPKHYVGILPIAQATLTIDSVDYDPVLTTCTANNPQISLQGVTDMAFSNCTFDGTELKSNYSGRLNNISFTGTVDVKLNK